MPQIAPKSEASVPEKSLNRRNQIIRLAVDLLLNAGPTISDKDRQSHDRLLTDLARESGIVMRRELAERFATRDDAPPGLVCLLAQDEIEVAAPLLRHSSVLTDDALIEIAITRTSDHRLAIAERASLCAELVSQLLFVEERALCHRLARNHGIVMTDVNRQMFQKLARHDGHLAHILGARPDWETPEEPRWSVKDFWHADGSSRRDMLLNVAADAAQHQSHGRLGAPLRHANPVDKAGALAGLTRLAAARESEMFQQLLARVTGLSVTHIGLALADPGGEVFALLCRAAGFSVDQFTTLLLAHCPGETPSVRRVYLLAELYLSVPQNVAWRFIEEWSDCDISAPMESAKQEEGQPVSKSDGLEEPAEQASTGRPDGTYGDDSSPRDQDAPASLVPAEQASAEAPPSNPRRSVNASQRRAIALTRISQAAPIPRALSA